MNILIVDDETNILKTTSIALRTLGHQAFAAEDSRQALKTLNSEHVDAMFLDIMLGKENGMDFLTQLRKDGWRLPVILFTAYSSVQSAVDGMKCGAFDYIEKPFMPEDIEQVLGRLEEDAGLRARIHNLESQIAADNPTLLMESAEPTMQQLYQLAFKAAPSMANILILGESGTGKTVLARNIHESSDRREKPFITVHCPSLSKELLESELFGHVKGSFTGAVKDTWGKVAAADGGTLFLDEIGELPLETQPKLLRLLQEKAYERVGENETRTADLRLIAATNRDLKDHVREGHFREDLFYRLNVISLKMPSLRHRPADILKLADNYLTFFARSLNRPALHLSEETYKRLLAHDWQGNLRELRNTLERAAILSENDEITPEDLPQEFSEPGNPVPIPGQDITLAELEEAHIRRVLQRISSLETASRTLGIDTATLYRKRKKLGLL